MMYCEYVDGDVVAVKTFFMAGAVRAAIFCPTTVEPVNETMRTWWWLDLPLTRGRVWASLGDAEDNGDLFFVEDSEFCLCIGDVNDVNYVLLLLKMIEGLCFFGVKPLGE